ncbi:MoaD/ThiS family protein [Nesterenkonia sp. F]|uniref:MoaD/ThiS family protein n=1 Tax=Nesterenkonia sp. F TaxID=795955 RepID=UPI000255C93B|nr:MoaD/ThiS family protein [Nesterenkonia sp. F]
MSPGITLRFFAAAAEAAGVESLRLPLEDAISLPALRDELPRLLAERTEREAVAAPSSDAPSLETVLPRCSFLVDGVRAGTTEGAGATVLRGGETVDVLPPFAGG